MSLISTSCGHISWQGYGDPYMPPLILLMGLGMPAAAWPKALIEKLVRSGLYVVTPDNRDSGASSQISQSVSYASVLASVAKFLAGGAVNGPYRLEDMASDMEELMNRLGIERAHVAGISMGGMIAQVLASRAPHRVISLTCISSATGNPLTGFGKISAVKAVLKPVPKDADNAVLRAHYRDLFKVIGSAETQYTDEELDAVIDVCRKNSVTAESTARQLLAILASGDRRTQLRQLVTPTLVIHGREDPLLPLRAGREIARTIEGAKLIELSGMGHDLPPSHLGTIAAAIAEHCYSRTLR